MRRQMMLKVLAILEILGGGLGPVWVIGAWAWARFPVEGLLGVIVGTAFFLMTLFAGVMLWQDRRSGYVASVVVQLAQLLKIATPTFAFMICLGGDLAVVWVTHQDPAGKPFRVLTFHSQAGPFSVVEIGRPAGASQVFGVSIVSCIALGVLRKGRQPASGDEQHPADAAPVSVSVVQEGSEPDWVLPFWMKIALVLFGLVVISCGGLLVLSR